MSNFRLTKAHGRDNYYVSWTEGGKPKRKTTGTKCEQTARQFLADIRAGFTEPPSQITLNTVKDEYLKHKEREYRLAGLPAARYKSNLECSLNPICAEMGDLRIDQISQRLGREYIDRRKKLNRSNSTIAKEIALLNAAINYVTREGWNINYQPLKQPPKSPPRDKWLKPEQAKQFLESIETHHIKLFAYLGFYTLARKGAILELTWDRVDLDNDLINYNNPNRTFTSKRRVAVPIGKALKKQLEIALELAQTDYVIEYNGKPVKDIKKGFKSAADNCKFDITPHCLRHTGATLMAQRGVDIFTIAGLLGDSVKTAMQNYAKHHPDYLKKGIMALEEICA